MNWILVGSHKSIFDLKQLIFRRLNWTNFEITSTEKKNIYNIKLNGELQPEYRIIKKGDRYRLEALIYRGKQ